MKTKIVETISAKSFGTSTLQDVIEVSLTVQEFLDALDKNGFPWNKGDFQAKGTNSSCAIGQVGRNLGLDPQNDYSAFWALQDAFSGLYEGDSIVGYNDGLAESYTDVVEYVHSKLDNLADKEVSFTYRKGARFV